MSRKNVPGSRAGGIFTGQGRSFVKKSRYNIQIREALMPTRLTIVLFSVLLIGLIACTSPGRVYSFVQREDGKVYIVDRTGERWDVTQAESLGFKPERFRYGLGRDAFTPLDDSRLGEYAGDVPKRMRVIGIADEETAQAYSVSALSRHEIANSRLGAKPIAVGY
jgi:hypothetical protein